MNSFHPCASDVPGYQSVQQGISHGIVLLIIPLRIALVDLGMSWLVTIILWPINFRGQAEHFLLIKRVEYKVHNQMTSYGAIWLMFWCCIRAMADADN